MSGVLFPCWITSFFDSVESLAMEWDWASMGSLPPRLLFVNRQGSKISWKGEEQTILVTSLKPRSRLRPKHPNAAFRVQCQSSASHNGPPTHTGWVSNPRSRKWGLCYWICNLHNPKTASPADILYAGSTWTFRLSVLLMAWNVERIGAHVEQ